MKISFQNEAYFSIKIKLTDKNETKRQLAAHRDYFSIAKRPDRISHNIWMFMWHFSLYFKI